MTHSLIRKDTECVWNFIALSTSICGSGMISRPWDLTAWEYVTINNEIQLHSFVICNVLLSSRGRGFVNTWQEFYTKGNFSNTNFKLLAVFYLWMFYRANLSMGVTINPEMLILSLILEDLLCFSVFSNRCRRWNQHKISYKNGSIFMIVQYRSWKTRGDQVCYVLFVWKTVLNHSALFKAYVWVVLSEH